MPVELKLLISNILYSATTQVEGTTESTTAENIISKDNSLMRMLESSDDLSGVSMYLKDILYILAILVVALAVLTVFMYIYRYIVRKKSNYKKNDDDFLDN